VIFAEDVPEKQALELELLSQKHKKWIMGPASVGILIPGHIKLGAIGGIDYRQLVSSQLLTAGNVAVFSASGGMTNEIIRIVTGNGKRISFSLHFGGDRFPIIQPKDAFLLAESDSQTEVIVYYGELGGFDEYEIAELMKNKKITKPVICYIAGTVSDLFETPPQFGHAKAMAEQKGESATDKKNALREVGAIVADSFGEFVEHITKISTTTRVEEKDYTTIMEDMQHRKPALITTSISKDFEGHAMVLQEDLLTFAKSHSFAYEVASMFLGKKIASKELEEFVDFVLRILVDHGPYVSGAVNTIITARAGRDLVSSLATGILTIGPRFGGAINEAARNWLNGNKGEKSPHEFVEEFAKQKKYISGIGHKKYRADFPDPRVEELLLFTQKLEKKQFTLFAKEVEKITTAKKGNLILNVDGTIAAVLLDILHEKEGMTFSELEKLVDVEFFNALFVLSRSVGFISHFIDQKRLDEGLFRLDEDLVAEAEL
jgi:succinyl-CoA synthetase alpha subunit